MNDQSDNPSHHEWMLLPWSYISLRTRNNSMDPSWRIDPTTHRTMSKRSTMELLKWILCPHRVHIGTVFQRVFLQFWEVFSIWPNSVSVTEWGLPWTTHCETWTRRVPFPGQLEFVVNGRLLTQRLRLAETLQTQHVQIVHNMFS